MYKVLSTQLTVGVVKNVYSEILDYLSITSDAVIDLGQVEYVDTAGIALILACWQYACANNIECRFRANEVINKAVRAYSIELP